MKLQNYLCSSSGRSLVGSKGGVISDGISSLPCNNADRLGATSSSHIPSSCSTDSCGTDCAAFFFFLAFDFFFFV